jgi:hypothetical protein
METLGSGLTPAAAAPLAWWVSRRYPSQPLSRASKARRKRERCILEGDAGCIDEPHFHK